MVVATQPRGLLIRGSHPAQLACAKLPATFQMSLELLVDFPGQLLSAQDLQDFYTTGTLPCSEEACSLYAAPSASSTLTSSYTL